MLARRDLTEAALCCDASKTVAETCKLVVAEPRELVDTAAARLVSTIHSCMSYSMV